MKIRKNIAILRRNRRFTSYRIVATEIRMEITYEI